LHCDLSAPFRKSLLLTCNADTRGFADLRTVAGWQVCPSTGQPCDCSAGADSGTNSDDKDAMYGGTALKTPTAEPIFPPELRKRTVPELALPGPLAAWYRCAPCFLRASRGPRTKSC